VVPDESSDMLGSVQIGDVWGIGRQWSKKLRDIGIRTALDLAEMDAMHIRESFNIDAMKTAMELRGCRHFGFEQSPQQRKTLLRSRSFGWYVTTWQEMSEAIASHATRAAEKLRNEGLVAQVLRIFFHTSLFNRTDPRHSAHATIELIPPTNVTHTIIKAAIGAAHPLWKEGYKYKRAGVYLLELSKGPVQCSLFDSQEERLRDKRIMSLLDAVNTGMGSGMLHFAASGVRRLQGHRARDMRQLRRSPGYTTRWDELPKVNCDATSQAKRRV